MKMTSKTFFTKDFKGVEFKCYAQYSSCWIVDLETNLTKKINVRKYTAMGCSCNTLRGLKQVISNL